MKLAVLSDIHSNHAALARCLREMEERQVDAYLLLGDYVSDCPYPQKTMDLLRKIPKPCYAVRGNREESLLAHQDGFADEWSYSSGTGSLLYTYENLSEEALAWFRGLPITRLVELDGFPTLRICHGSPEKARGTLYFDAETARKTLRKLDAPYLLCGHTHEQGSFSADGKKLVNPGAVRQGNVAQCAILHGTAAEWREEFLTLSYDAARYAEEFEESGFTACAFVWAKTVQKELQTGQALLRECVPRAFRYVAERTSDIDEESCWERAARECGIL